MTNRRELADRLEEARCGNCTHFKPQEVVVNSMRMFGPEKVETKTYCTWIPPFPFWAMLDWKPSHGNDAYVRQRDPDDGYGCAAFLSRLDAEGKGGEA